MTTEHAYQNAVSKYNKTVQEMIEISFSNYNKDLNKLAHVENSYKYQRNRHCDTKIQQAAGHVTLLAM